MLYIKQEGSKLPDQSAKSARHRPNLATVSILLENKSHLCNQLEAIAQAAQLSQHHQAADLESSPEVLCTQCSLLPALPPVVCAQYQMFMLREESWHNEVDCYNINTL